MAITKNSASLMEFVAHCLHNAESVKIELDENLYSGTVERWKIGQFIVFKTSNIDNSLVGIPAGFSGLKLKVIGKSGAVRNFTTKILKKKLPLIMLSFPASEIEKVDREFERVYVQLDTPVILTKRIGDILPDETTHVGTITNISKGGCAISTQLGLHKGDKINFFMEVSSTSGKKSLDLLGIVRGVQKYDNGTASYGIEYQKLNRETKNEIDTFMDRRLGMLSQNIISSEEAGVLEKLKALHQKELEQMIEPEFHIRK
ncbi:MAG: PilZ domain-containing protein [Nitrospinota bacterium]|nr:PilZ domain-containing protein [Nitrospinota bacterium]